MRDFVDGTAFNNEQGNRARKLFAAVVLAALDDAIADDKKYGNGPEQIARWARPSSSRFYRGYYIGGGAVFGGDARDVRREGTWGWDFAPSYSRVKLRWWHGRRLQGGGGEYRSDGRIPLSWRELLP